MELASLFASERGTLGATSSWPPSWRRLVFVERGRCRCLMREGVSYFDSPFILASTGSTISTRLDAASGVALQFAPRVADELSYRLGGDDGSLLSCAEPICLRLKKAEAEAYRGLFDDIADAWRARQGGDLILVRATGLLVRLRRFGSVTHRTDRSSSADVSAIEAFIKARFRESLSLEKMADELGYSPPYLSRYFKQKTGLCLFEYVNARRVAEACLLLKGTDKTVTEIAFEVGYNNLSFFNRYFRKLMDASPQEYRKRSMDRRES